MTLKLASFLLVMFALVVGSLSAHSFKRPDLPEKQANWVGAENERIVDSYWTPTEDSTMNHDIYFNENGNEAIKVVMPPLHYNFNSDKGTEQYYQQEEINQNTVQYARKPKTITRLPEVAFTVPKNEEKDKFIIEIVNDDEVNDHDPCKPTRFVQAEPKDKRSHYEVTEGNRNDGLTSGKNYGYFPETPRHVNQEGHTILLNTGKNNKTNTLQNILSYRTSSNDKSRNYEISRRTQMYFLPIQFNTPKRKYNRQNHLPVDPLIAVLLSNYGVYLPQFYKANSGYKNLYGHLAFNNIHNNNPFGNYKLYSDTDYDYDDSLNQ